jgi:hypothetical protein
LKTEEEVRRYREGLKEGEGGQGKSRSVVRLEEGEELLTWTAVVSDGEFVGVAGKLERLDVDSVVVALSLRLFLFFYYNNYITP